MISSAPSIDRSLRHRLLGGGRLAAGLLVTVAACGGEAVTDDAAVPALDAFSAELDSATPPLDAFSADDAFALPTEDAFVAVDAVSMPGEDAPGPSSCGGARPDISGVTGTEGLVIARDGAIYYSQSAAVGRVGTDGSVDDAFVSLPRTASTVWGMVLDAANEHLYVGSPSAATIYDIDLTASPPAATAFVTSAGGPNGLTLGPDGALYYSDFSGGRVMRVALPAGGTPTMVARVGSANGVAFDDMGRLLVCNYSAGQLVRLTLTAGVESGREMVASSLGSPDGVALDAEGTIYVTDNGRGRLLQLAPDGSATVLSMGVRSAASLDFGSGALDCEDIYVASGGTMARYEMGAVAGRAVPWH